MQTVTVHSEFKPLRKFVNLIFYLNVSLNVIDKKKMLQGTSTEKDEGGEDNF